MAISIPDDVFRRGEQFAKRHRLSRSELYTAALIRMLESEPADDVTRAYDTAFDDDTHDRFTDAASRKILADIEWDRE